MDRQTDQLVLRRILLQQSAEDFRVFQLQPRAALTKHQALNLIETKAFVYKTNKSGTAVKWIQAIDMAPECAGLPPRPSRLAKWLQCWRTTEAAVMQPGEGYAR